MSALNNAYWDKYATDFASHYNEEMAKFIRDLALSLRASSVLEVGCSAGNDLRLFSNQISVGGIDNNEHAISKAKENLPQFEFKLGSITSIPYESSSFDFVFTRNTLNYIEDSDLQNGLDEMFRVSKKYIMNIELFSEDDSIIDYTPVKTIGRNMKDLWLNYQVKIISNVEMHHEIDPKKSRFVLIRKI